MSYSPASNGKATSGCTSEPSLVATSDKNVFSCSCDDFLVISHDQLPPRAASQNSDNGLVSSTAAIENESIVAGCLPVAIHDSSPTPTPTPTGSSRAAWSGSSASNVTQWASPNLSPADIGAAWSRQQLQQTLRSRRTTESSAPLHSLSPATGRVSKMSFRHCSSSASEVIRRYESFQSPSFKEYRHWKEAKWGEDGLDEVEFDDNDDINLELSLPNIFTRPLALSLPGLPSSSDFWLAVESLQTRLVAGVLSITDMILSSEYYIARPGELLAACKAAVAVWVPRPPAWIAVPLMSVVASSYGGSDAGEDEDDEMDIDLALDDDDDDEGTPRRTTRLRKVSEGSDIDSCLSDAGSVPMSVASHLALRVQESTSRMTQVVCGVALGIVAAISFTLVYIYASLRICWRYVSNSFPAARSASFSSSPTSTSSAYHAHNRVAGSRLSKGQMPPAPHAA